MTNKQIEDILNSSQLSEVEKFIASECETYINKDFADATISILRREIINSGLTLEYIKEQLVLRKDAIIKFGIQFFTALKSKPIEEEYPKGEALVKSERPKVIASHGIGLGFAVKYAIYLHFLENCPEELIEYIKKERIPNAKKFCKTLKELYNL